MKKAPAALKNYLQEYRLFQQRLLIAILFVIAAFSMVLVRLFFLQIVQHDRYTTLAEQNQLNYQPLEPKRGLIFDRNGILLAENIPVFSLEIIPQYVKNLEATIANLKKIIAINDDDINEFNKQFQQTRHFQSVPLKSRLTEEEVSTFMVHQYYFPGVLIKAHLLRYYPMGTAMAHVLGYVGRINEKELSTIDPINYNVTDYIGKIGIEKFYEKQLHGTMGYAQVENDASGRIIREIKRTAPIPGKDLYLTLDSRLQLAATTALGDSPGAVVAIDPNNGEILALVSQPSFDANLFVNGIKHEAYTLLRNAPYNPLYNRAIRGQYPLASTIKPFLALMGLDSGIITPYDLVQDPGYFQLRLQAHTYRDWLKGGHGVVNVSRAIIGSCDTFFYNLAYHAGIERIDTILTRFGYGARTNVDLTEELPGLVASPRWKKQRFGKAWYMGDTINAGIGQGFLLGTPLQLAHATAALAMRGTHYQPHLLLKSVATNNIPNISQPQPLDPIIIKPFAWDVVLEAMRDVIASPSGTAFRRFGDKANYTAAGKTGTAQLFTMKRNHIKQSTLPEHLRDHSLFIVYAPIERPRIALAVIVEHNTNAVQVARKILDFYFTATTTRKEETS